MLQAMVSKASSLDIGGTSESASSSASAKTSGSASNGNLAAERAASAFVGYFVAAFLVVPLDRITRLMQAMPASLPASASALTVSRLVVRRQGVGGLFQGLDSHMMIAPYTTFYYTIYDDFFQRTKAYDPARADLAPLVAAVGARSIEVTFRMPLELIRTQLQSAEGNVRAMDLVRNQLRQQLRDQPSSWFRGFIPTLVRDVPFSAIYWAGYEFNKSRLVVPHAWVPDEDLRTFSHSFVCGAGAGLFAALILTPADVVKTLRQQLAQSGEQKSYAEILRLVRTSPRRSMAGVGPRLLRIPIGMATMMSVLEVTRSAFERRRSSEESSER